MSQNQKLDRNKTPIDILPYDYWAEHAVLGCIIIDNDIASSVLDFLSPDDFYDPAHATAFRAIRILNESQDAIDFATIPKAVERLIVANNAKKFESRIELKEITFEDVADYINPAPKPSSWRTYATQVKERALRREASKAAGKIARLTINGEPLDGIATAFSEFQDKLSASIQPDPVKPIGDVLREMVADWDLRYSKGTGLCGISTGYDEIDRYTAGFEPGKLYVFAARPSHTKTSLAANIALNCVAAGVGAFFVTSEVPNAGLCELMAGSLASINTKRMKRGDSSKEDMERFNEAVAKIVDMPIYCDDTPNISVQSIYRRAKHLVEKKGVRIVFIDYLQRLKFDGMQKSWNEEREINEMCKALKTTARTLNVPIILLAQLNRDVEKQGRQRYPKVSDCKGSGSIEQEADAIFLLWYGYKAGWPHDSSPDEIDVILGKQRDGDTAQFKLRFRGEYRRHENMPIREPRPVVSNYQDVNDMPPTLSKP